LDGLSSIIGVLAKSQLIRTLGIHFEMVNAMKPEPKPQSDNQSDAPAELVMHKRVVKMSDGKRDMIYFTFEVKHV
jgi:hypothetical protein